MPTLVRLDQVRRPDEFDDTLSQGSLDGLEGASVDMEDLVNGLLSRIKLTQGTTNWYDAVTEDVETLAARAKLEDKLALSRVQVLTDLTVPAASAFCVLRVASSEAPTLDSAFGASTKGAVCAQISGGTKATATTGSVGNNNGLDWEARTAGSWAEGISVAVNVPVGPGEPFAINVNNVPGNDKPTIDITITCETDGGGVNQTTAADVISGIQGDATANKLVTVDHTSGSSGAGLMENESETLAGGASGIGDAVLDEITGVNAVNPKNLVRIRDASTRNPILDGSDEVFGLLQVGGYANDDTAFDDVSEVVQLSFVKRSGDDLVLADTSAIGGKTIEYSYAQRNDLYSLNEQYFMGEGVFSDQDASVSVTMDNAYNGGSVVTVDSTDVDFQLDTGRLFKVSDGQGADFLEVLNDMGGSGPTLEVNVTVLDINNGNTADFSGGAQFDSDGTPIKVGDTSGEISRAAALAVKTTAGDLDLVGAAELVLTDQRMADIPFTDAVDSGWSLPLDNPASIVAAINKAATIGGVDMTVATLTLGSDYAQDANIPGGGWIDLTSRTIDMNAPGSTDTFIFLNGRLLLGGNGTTNNDVYNGDTLANGDIKVDFANGVKTGDVFIAVSFQE